MNKFIVEINTFVLYAVLTLLWLFVLGMLATGHGLVGLAVGVIGTFVWAILSGVWFLLLSILETLQEIAKTR